MERSMDEFTASTPRFGRSWPVKKKQILQYLNSLLDFNLVILNSKDVKLNFLA